MDDWGLTASERRMLPTWLQQAINEFDSAAAGYDAALARMWALHGPITPSVRADLIKAKARVDAAEKQVTAAMERWRRSL